MNQRIGNNKESEQKIARILILAIVLIGTAISCQKSLDGPTLVIQEEAPVKTEEISDTPKSDFPTGLLTKSTKNKTKTELQTSPPSTEELSKLRVSGNRIVTKDGQEIRLRGVNIEDPFMLDNQDITEDGVPDPHFLEIATDFARINTLGANIVRIAIYPGYYFLVGENYLTTYVDRMVDLAEENGLYALLEYHAIGRPEGWYPSEFDKTIPDHPAKIYYTDSNMAVKFWNTISIRYGQRAHVLFDIYNEPADETANFDWEDWRKTGELLITAIRRHSDNIILGPGPYWTSDLSEVSNNPYSDSNLVYAVHIYPGSLDEEADQISEWEKRFGFLAETYPVMVSEWGFHDGGDRVTNGTLKSFGRPFLEYLNQKNLHWIAYIYHPFAEPPMLESDWTTLTEFGEFVKEQLQD